MSSEVIAYVKKLGHSGRFGRGGVRWRRWAEEGERESLAAESMSRCVALFIGLYCWLLETPDTGQRTDSL